ncbi:MAG: hypothetical protein DRN04_06500 [Thermoprotei archaeon]|nr:MAG: hypothetical protein DRN04_06500 [Thermoprotei archaeon]
MLFEHIFFRVVRIAAVSDIHHPASTILVKLAQVLRKSEIDLIVFAGDVVNWADEKYFKKLLKFIRRFFKGPLLAVSGNHEHWLSGREKRRGLTSIEKLNKLAKLYEEYNGVLLDVKGPCRIGDLYVVGVVGWYNYSYAQGLGFTEKDFENCNP